ncbi:HD-GYP domain-containing protein [uncultured Pseudodesulfovibrio sp.]|uniref:HD-GYP domain-containing protein n=1 Tax=uncultured Pseudodesulfovibrio sp. TaxID=2035858 RepID=UPI0029C7D24E|nr:HD-GYP domain-containing protein [uncultured Pseudodesulfovibrio sp.]
MLAGNHLAEGGAGSIVRSGTPDSARFITTVMHQFAESLGFAIDAKDPYTSMHSEEVAEVSHALALSMGLSPCEADIIHVAGHLHDIGKIGVPDSVLKKRGPLNTSEWQAVRRHPKAGADILRPVAALNNLGVVDMVLHHHERYDGKGYPDRLKGTQIPLGARIIAVADSLSAMLQDRPYRVSKDFDAARDEILKCSGTQFDPRVVQAFEKSGDIIRGMVNILSSSGRNS